MVVEPENKRRILAVIEVDDDRAVREDMGTLEYLYREMGWCEESGIYLADAKILDEDDPDDWNAIAYTEEIFG